MSAFRTPCWLASLGHCFLVACGNASSSPHPTPETDAAGRAGTTSAIGGGGGGGGGTDGRPTLDLSDGPDTTSDNTPSHLGEGGEGGQPFYPAIVDLCINPEDIPENWGGAPGAEDGSCEKGALGEFTFSGCRYQLLDATPSNVDQFGGAHSPCCYASRLIACP